MPQCDNTATQGLYQNIMDLPNYQGMDRLSLWSDAVVASVQAPGPGWLVTTFGGSQDFLNTAADMTATAGLVVGFGALTGVAAPECAAVAGTMLVGAFVFYAVAMALKADGY